MQYESYTYVYCSYTYTYKRIRSTSAEEIYTAALQLQHQLLSLLDIKHWPRQINQAIKHITNSSVTESAAAHDCPTDSEARAVPDHSPNNFSKTTIIDILGTDPEPSVPELSWVTYNKARGALQLEIHTQNHVYGTPRAGQHGISVITIDPGRFSPPNFVRIQAQT